MKKTKEDKAAIADELFATPKVALASEIDHLRRQLDDDPTLFDEIMLRSRISGLEQALAVVLAAQIEAS